jgi:cytochrome c
MSRALPLIFLSLGAVLGGCSDTRPNAVGDPARGRIALTQYACHACHVIPGNTSSEVPVAPPLAGLANRRTIAGEFPNTPDHLIAWIRDPQAMDPATAMPNMHVSERDARDIAAYLLSAR